MWWSDIGATSERASGSTSVFKHLCQVRSLILLSEVGDVDVALQLTLFFSLGSLCGERRGVANPEMECILSAPEAHLCFLHTGNVQGGATTRC